MNDDPITPDMAEHYDEMDAADAHYDDMKALDGVFARARDALDALECDPTWDEQPCPHPVDMMGTVFALPYPNGNIPGGARRVCTACWQDFGPLTAAELSTGVAQYPSIAEREDATALAVEGRKMTTYFAANPGDVDPIIVGPLLALIDHLDYQAMILRNRVESISRMEQQEHANLARVVQERDAAEDDVLALLAQVDAFNDGDPDGIDTGPLRSRYPVLRSRATFADMARWHD